MRRYPRMSAPPHLCVLSSGAIVAVGVLTRAEGDVARLSAVREMLHACVYKQAMGLEDVQRLAALMQEHHREMSADLLALSSEIEVLYAR